MNSQRITTLLLFLAVGALGVALFVLAACDTAYRGHRGLPENHPDGVSMEDYGDAQDPLWWPRPCETGKTEIPKLTAP